MKRFVTPWSLTILFSYLSCIIYYFIAEGKLRQQTSVGDIYSRPDESLKIETKRIRLSGISFKTRTPLFFVLSHEAKGIPGSSSATY